jgi:hypothetical protein
MRTRYFLAIIAAASLVLLVGCGDGNGLKGDSFSVDSLEGTYQIQSGCTAQFDGVEGTLDGCVLEDAFSYPPITVESGGATFEEETITVDASTYYEVDSSCYGTVRGDIEVSGTLTKTDGRLVDGPFSALAGQWTGTLTAVESAPPYEVVDGAPAECDPFEGDEVQHAMDVQADVMGDTIDVTTDDGQFEITSDGDQVTVDGQQYEQQ